MTKRTLILFLVVVLAVIVASAEERQATLTTADSAELPLSTRTTPVLVTNFPVDADGNMRVVEQSTQPRQVEVVNLPGVQQVAGQVTVANLPLDITGNLRVAGVVTPAPSLPHFIGLTESVFAEGSPILTLSHACDAQFPGTRLCEEPELLKAIPSPPPLPGQAVLIMYTEGSRLRSSCMSSAGELFACGSGPLPVACCGF